MLATVAVAGLVVAGLVAGCGGPTGLGDSSPPGSLDPASPRLSAVDVAFDREAIEVPAGRPFVLVFENREALSHNVSLYADPASQRRVFEGLLFAGPATRWYPIPALEAGTYAFVCDLHPSMRGELRAT
jgi:plastocyanin